MNVNIRNKKASFEYEILDKYVAGIALTGTEIKSIRNSKASIGEGFCSFIGDELYARNIHISEYAEGTYNNHEIKRDRKLLLNRNELNKLQKKLKDVGLTIIPIRLFINERGFAKLEIALGRGKKLYDKREDLKKKDANRQIDRHIR